MPASSSDARRELRARILDREQVIGLSFVESTRVPGNFFLGGNAVSKDKAENSSRAGLDVILLIRQYHSE